VEAFFAYLVNFIIIPFVIFDISKIVKEEKVEKKIKI
jgi:hypothetical protein